MGLYYMFFEGEFVHATIFIIPSLEFKSSFKNIYKGFNSVDSIFHMQKLIKWKKKKRKERGNNIPKTGIYIYIYTHTPLYWIEGWNYKQKNFYKRQGKKIKNLKNKDQIEIIRIRIYEGDFLH
jgi:hypothetical protein